MKPCPQCRGSNLATGKMRNAQGRSGRVAFVPDQMKFWTFSLTGGPLVKDAYAGMDCGLIWSTTNPLALSEFVKTKTKQLQPK